MFGNRKRLDHAITRLYELEDENQRLEKEISQLEEKILFLNQHITKLNTSNETILYIKWENKLWVLSIKQHLNYKKQVDDLKFLLYNFDTQISPPHYYGKLWIEPIYDIKTSLLKYLTIGDFIVRKEYQNRGLGHLILSESLLWLAQVFGEDITIKGWLSPEDERDDANRLKRDHIYRKFGFNINGRQLSLSKMPMSILESEIKKHLEK